MAIWAILILAFILPKENRNRKTLWLLLPMAIVQVFWQFIASLTISESDIVYINVLFNSLLVSFTVCWLLAGRLSRMNRIFAFFASLLLFALIGASEIVSVGDQIFELYLAYCLLSAALVLGLVITRWIMQGKYRPIIFILCSFVSIAVLAFVTAIVLFVIECMEYSSDFGDFIEFMVAGFVLGLVLFVGVLPYELLFVLNGFWKDRFRLLMKYYDLPDDINLKGKVIRPADEDINLPAMDRISIADSNK